MRSSSAPSATAAAEARPLGTVLDEPEAPPRIVLAGLSAPALSARLANDAVVLSGPEGGRPIPVEASHALQSLLPLGPRPLHLVGIGAGAVLAFEIAAQLLARRHPPLSLILVDPAAEDSVPDGSVHPYRPPLLELPGLLVLTGDSTATGTPRPDPRLEWVAQYRRAPAIVRIEEAQFNLNDSAPGARWLAGVATAIARWTAGD